MDPRETIVAYAASTRRRLRGGMLDYWWRVSRDDVAGGFLLPDDVVRRPWRRWARTLAHRSRDRPTDDKQVVTQARLVWLFAHAHRAGYDPDGRYLDAADQGYRFLIEHFRDPDRDGYCWTTDRGGTPRNEVKHLYAQAFVIYGFVELARASGAPEPLADALDLCRAVERELHDDTSGGWREHAERDWGPVAESDRRVAVPFTGRKSGNAVVHWLEATSELYAETHDDGVRRSLEEALGLCRRHLFPPDPAQAREPFLPDWTPDPDVEPIVSYGHNVEFAWLMLRAQDVLAIPRDWDHFYAYVDHALAHGFDHHRGGAFSAGHGNEPADRRHKVAWVQYELMVALGVALDRQDDDGYALALAQTIEFVERHMTDRRDGVMVEAVEEDGTRRWPRKSGDWKAGYHDVRAAVKIAGGCPEQQAPDEPSR